MKAEMKAGARRGERREKDKKRISLMAAKRAEKATRRAAEEEEQEERRKKVFDFIDSFRYTGSRSSSRAPSPSPSVNVNVKKRRTHKDKGTSVRAATKQRQLPKDQDQDIRLHTPFATIAPGTRPRTRRSTLTAAEKVMDAYRRVPPGFNFTPPRSSHRLLQEDHAFDPWRVLIICMLLNNTTGAQVKKLVDDLFALCPDAQTTIQVDVELIEHVIRTLGLQRKRARMIKILSQEYLDPDWTHVSFLPGVGKYAADAYAIFCTGKGADVRPDDHKLVDYWNSIYGNSSDSGVMPQYADEPSTKRAAPVAGSESCNKRKKQVRELESEKETAGTTYKTGMSNNGLTNCRDASVSHFYLRGLIQEVIRTHQCTTWLSAADNVVAHIGESKANELDTKVKMLRIDEIKLRALESGLMAELLDIVGNA